MGNIRAEACVGSVRFNVENWVFIYVPILIAQMYTWKRHKVYHHNTENKVRKSFRINNSENDIYDILYTCLYLEIRPLVLTKKKFFRSQSTIETNLVIKKNLFNLKVHFGTIS